MVLFLPCLVRFGKMPTYPGKLTGVLVVSLGLIYFLCGADCPDNFFV